MGGSTAIAISCITDLTQDEQPTYAPLVTCTHRCNGMMWQQVASTWRASGSGALLAACTPTRLFEETSGAAAGNAGEIWYYNGPSVCAETRYMLYQPLEALACSTARATNTDCMLLVAQMLLTHHCCCNIPALQWCLHHTAEGCLPRRVWRPLCVINLQNLRVCRCAAIALRQKVV
jgi:hypothetical protein